LGVSKKIRRKLIIAKFSKEEVLYDIANLSDGVLATLSGFTKYSDLSKLQNALYDFVEGASRHQQFDTWMDAWNAYIDSGEFTPLWASAPAEITINGVDYLIEVHPDGNHYRTIPVGGEWDRYWWHIYDLRSISRKLYDDFLLWQSGRKNINGKSY